MIFQFTGFSGTAEEPSCAKRAPTKRTNFPPRFLRSFSQSGSPPDAKDTLEELSRKFHEAPTLERKLAAEVALRAHLESLNAER